MIVDQQDMTFWLGILRDHTFFIVSSLSPSERDAIIQGDGLRKTFEDLLKRADSVNEKEAAEATEELIAYKKDVLTRLLNCRIGIHLLPSDINGMINEAREFLRVLNRAQRQPESGPRLLLHLHRLWVHDAAGHCSMLYRTLDPTEEPLIEELRGFEHEFNLLYLKTDTKTQFYSKLNQDFPSLYELLRETREKVMEHIDLLQSLENKMQRCTLETNGSPLMPNHMIREETHFLNQLAKMLER